MRWVPVAVSTAVAVSLSMAGGVPEALAVPQDRGLESHASVSHLVDRAAPRIAAADEGGRYEVSGRAVQFPGLRVSVERSVEGKKSVSDGVTVLDTSESDYAVRPAGESVRIISVAYQADQLRQEYDFEGKYLQKEAEGWVSVCDERGAKPVAMIAQQGRGGGVRGGHGLLRGGS